MLVREMVEEVVKALVDKPEKVEVTEISGERAMIIQVRVDSSDVRYVIGHDGCTADALRTILGAAGPRFGKRYCLEILE